MDHLSEAEFLEERIVIGWTVQFGRRHCSELVHGSFPKRKLWQHVKMTRIASVRELGDT